MDLQELATREPVTVVIPTIPPRRALHRQAVRSALGQTLMPASITSIVDSEGRGPGPTRNALLRDVRTPWVAFLDDDDTFLSGHLETCLLTALDEEADLVYPWYHCPQGDPFGPLHGIRHDWHDPVWSGTLHAGNFIPVTVLVRTDLLRDVGGFQVWPGGPVGSERWEDWGAWMALLQAGAHFAHVPIQTWVWNRHADSYAGSAWNH